MPLPSTPFLSHHLLSPTRGTPAQMKRAPQPREPGGQNPACPQPCLAQCQSSHSKEGHDKRGGRAEAQTSPQTLQEMPAPNRHGAAQPNKCKVCCLLSSVLSKASNDNASVEPVLHTSAKCNSRSYNKVEGRINTLKRKNKNTTHTNPHNSHLQINYT